MTWCSASDPARSRPWSSGRPGSSSWSPYPHGYDAEHVRDALTLAVQRLPDRLHKSLTWDNGKEMAQHARFSVDTGVQVQFL